MLIQFAWTKEYHITDLIREVSQVFGDVEVQDLQKVNALPSLKYGMQLMNWMGNQP